MNSGANDLAKMTVLLGTLNHNGLREMRQRILFEAPASRPRDLVIQLIDIYISVGEDPHARARVAAGILAAIKEVSDGALRCLPARQPPSSNRLLTIGLLASVVVCVCWLLNAFLRQ